jgi:uncharacterized membrane protein
MQFSVTSAIRFGWDTFWKRPWFFVLAVLLIFVANVAVEVVGRASDALFAGPAEDLGFVASLVQLALSTLVGMGVTAFALAAHDNPDTVELSALWHPYPFWKYFLLTILIALIVLAGVALVFALIAMLGLESGLAIGITLVLVLGAIVSLLLIFAGYLVIDRDLGPIAAMKESARMTRGNLWGLFGLLVLLALINLLGVLAFIVGVLISAPVSLLALTRAYRDLSGAPARSRPTRRLRLEAPRDGNLTEEN